MGAPTFIDLTNEIDSVAGRQLRLRVITIEQGESWSEGRNITHWSENKGDKPVVLIAVDVLKP